MHSSKEGAGILIIVVHLGVLGAKLNFQVPYVGSGQGKKCLVCIHFFQAAYTFFSYLFFLFSVCCCTAFVFLVNTVKTTQNKTHINMKSLRIVYFYLGDAFFHDRGGGRMNLLSFGEIREGICMPFLSLN